MDRNFRTRALLLAAAAVIADQAAKWWALTGLRRAGGHIALPGPLDFTFNFNESNAFGLTPVVGHATRWLLMSANFTVAGIILYLILAKPFRPLMLFGMSLIMAGAVGNALDRLLIGAVVDFLDLSKIGFVWIFNVADATLDLGIGLVMLSALRPERSGAPGVQGVPPLQAP